MNFTGKNCLPRGLISVVQTPFASDGGIDFASLERLLDDAIEAGVDGFLAPAVASEVECLSPDERFTLARRVADITRNRVSFIAGASSPNADECLSYIRHAESVNAAGCLVAVPNHLYETPERIVPFLQAIADGCRLPLLIQDLRWNDYGLSLPVMKELWDSIPNLAGFKIETVPAGPKYTQVRNELGDGAFLCGGWAIPQLIESLDRGVDAMIPESSMIRAYRAIFQLYRQGRREDAVTLFNRLLPILAFTNQEIAVSIAFFKRLLVRKGIFACECMRRGFEWDRYNLRVADESIDRYLEIELDIEKSVID